MKRFPAVVAYDISDNRVRRRVLGILRQWRLDGQKSVHECLLSDAEATELFLQLGTEIDTACDRLLLAWLVPRKPVMACGLGRHDTFKTTLVDLN